jgi:hypothetical protein
MSLSGVRLKTGKVAHGVHGGHGIVSAEVPVSMDKSFADGGGLYPRAANCSQSPLFVDLSVPLRTSA